MNEVLMIRIFVVLKMPLFTEASLSFLNISIHSWKNFIFQKTKVDPLFEKGFQI